MYKKLMFVILMGFCLSLLADNVNSAPFEKMKATPLPKDQFQPPYVPPFSAGDFCVIQNDDGTPVWLTADFDSGVGVAVYMDPEKCPVQIPYPFKITDVHFHLFGAFSGSSVWPVKIRVKVRELSENHECNGPGDILFSQSFVIPEDSGYFNIGPRPMNLSLSQPVCTSHPFFLEIEYETKTDIGDTLPSLLMDTLVAEADSCNNWGTEYGENVRWSDFWAPPPPGDAIIHATGYANASECWYWKPDRPNQEFPAPSGMPDFGQYQFGDSMALCGPTAIANCLWWFDAVPKGMNPPEFIRLLSDYFRTCPISGTDVDSIQDGLDRYFNDYGFSLYEHTFSMPEFLAMEDSLKRSQDIILLLGFWQEAAQDQWVRFGGHFVTMAGVCSDSLKIAFSDPARDAAEDGLPGRVRPLEHPPHTDGDSVHNDPQYVSHDIYQAIIPSESPGGLWALTEYLTPDELVLFEDQNFQPGQETYPYIQGEPVFAEIEYAIMICPSNWYWKPDTLPQAPSGMPDFDQNQDDWVSYCGPTAVANCLWWFDAVPDGWTPPQLIDTLATRMHCNPVWGTYVDTMQMALEQYFQDYEFALQESTFWRPNFYEMEDSLKRCQDIILLLGFWEEVEQDSFIRVGGHYVTMAGVCSESLKIAVSDPYWDNAEGSGPGRVRPPHASHPTDDTLHNDPAYVSQDIYASTLTSPSPGNPGWGLLEYPLGKSPIQDFVGKNFHPEQLQYYHADHEVKGPIYTEVEWAVMICPKPTAVEDEGEGSAITPKDFELYQSYPNPFNNQTIIKYNLLKSCQVTLTIYNILGQKVRTLVEGYQEAGAKMVNWNGKDKKGKDVASGIYFYQLKAGEITQTKRMVLLK